MAIGHRCFVACAAAALLTSCSKTSLPPEGEAGAPFFREKSQEFGNHLLSGRYKEAYNLLTFRTRKQMTIADFEALWGENTREFYSAGPPRMVCADIETTSKRELIEAGRIPEGVPENDVRAAALATFVIEGSCASQERCFEMWLLWVDESGEPRIAAMDTYWCD